ncbi:MAG TPA: hypothetical protein VLF40_06405 [Candidatus Saccharimonadales bacterium]|nr:hypothetical protein [Candidatus Saccharimonadales bacterium]
MWLLQTPTPFTEVEQRVRSYLHKKRAWLVDETTKKRYEFRPHITMQGTDEFGENGTFRCGRLYIIEQTGDYKEIVGKIGLGDVSS